MTRNSTCHAAVAGCRHAGVVMVTCHSAVAVTACLPRRRGRAACRRVSYLPRRRGSDMPWRHGKESLLATLLWQRVAVSLWQR